MVIEDHPHDLAALAEEERCKDGRRPSTADCPAGRRWRALHPPLRAAAWRRNSLMKKKRRWRKIRKSAAHVALDLELDDRIAEIARETCARVAPYPGYQDFEIARQRGFSDFDKRLVGAVHREQAGENGCTLTDLEVAALYPSRYWERVLAAMRRLRRRGIFRPTDNGVGFRVWLPQRYKWVPEPDYWPNRRTWTSVVRIPTPSES